MALLRAALPVLAFAVAVLGATAHAAQPQPAPTSTVQPAAPSPGPAAVPAPTSTVQPAAPSPGALRAPGKAAIDASEEQALGSSIPELDARPQLALAGKPIVRVEVEVEGGRWAGKPTLASVHPGEPLSLEAGRRAMREALDTGRFARAAAETFAEGDGAVLRIHLLPRRLIAAIQLTGGALDTGDTLEAAEVSDGGELTPPMLDQVGARIRAFYAAHGFPAAAVQADTTDTDQPDKVVLSIVIKPGAPRTVAERVFVIEPAFDKEVGDLKSRYRISRGARVDERVIADADREFTELLRQRGFLRAEVRHAVRAVGPAGYLYIYLEPGPRIVPAFDGNRAFDADQLTEGLNLENAPDGRVAELLERVRTFYVNRGFLDVEVSANEQGKPADPVHYLLFSIREHAQVRVVKRVFPCLGDPISADDMGSEIEAVLREELPGAELFSPGDPRSIARIFGDRSRRGGPVDLNPLMTYAPETYERAIKHLRDLLHSKGYLNALIGPVSVMRATCSRRSKAGECIPEPVKALPKSACQSDALGLPLPEPPVSEELTCRPDPARHVECSPEITLRIPINLGPQTTLYDIAFEGNRSVSEKDLYKIADLVPGSPLSNVDLDAARVRILEAYRNDGYAYAEVRSTIEPSPDRTRARVRFSVTERDQVMVADFVVKGAVRTDEALILRRVSLRRLRPFRLDLVRRSEERIAALGTFSSVSVSLEDPDVPQRRKRVVITVVEQSSQYLEPRLGFSSGEGVRFAFEYGHRNIGGLAIALTLRIQLSYLFDFLIVDPGVRQNYGIDPLPQAECPDALPCYRKELPIIQERLQRRNTVAITFPEVGLGPLVSLSLEGIDVRDNQRDYGLTKDAFVPTLAYRPIRQLNTQLSVSAERNDVTLFNQNPNTLPLLRIPEGTTIALSQRAAFSYDFRDNAFNAKKGGLISTSVEHVDAFPTLEKDNKATAVSHFIRLSGKVSGYIQLPWKLTLALSLAAGYNLQLTKTSKTYPDRLFFLGGGDSIRSFLADSVIPQDLAEKILKTPSELNNVTIRGGDFSVNPRVELRIPITDLFQTGIFLDAGNLWTSASAIDRIELRYGVGAGLRFTTPIGPLALDYGINPNPRPWEDFGAFHFSIGLF